MTAEIIDGELFLSRRAAVLSTMNLGLEIGAPFMHGRGGWINTTWSARRRTGEEAVDC
jgi:hypothetical protein